MDRPEIKPSDDLLALFGVGPISALTYNKDRSDDNNAEAESDARTAGYRRYEWEVVIDVVGKDGYCSVNQSVLDKFVILDVDINCYGCWQLTKEGKEICENWIRWIKAEERDLATYRKLQKKFAGV